MNLQAAFEQVKSTTSRKINLTKLHAKFIASGGESRHPQCTLKDTLNTRLKEELVSGNHLHKRREAVEILAPGKASHPIVTMSTVSSKHSLATQRKENLGHLLVGRPNFDKSSKSNPATERKQAGGKQRKGVNMFPQAALITDISTMMEEEPSIRQPNSSLAIHKSSDAEYFSACRPFNIKSRPKALIVDDNLACASEETSDMMLIASESPLRKTSRHVPSAIGCAAGVDEQTCRGDSIQALPSFKTLDRGKLARAINHNLSPSPQPHQHSAVKPKAQLLPSSPDRPKFQFNFFTGKRNSAANSFKSIQFEKISQSSKVENGRK